MAGPEQGEGKGHRAHGARGFLVSVASLVSARAYLALSQVIVLPIIARHLAVEDFALMATAMIVVIFATTISDGGLGRSLIRTPAMDRLEWSSVYWLMFGIGCGLAGLTMLAAPLAADWFGAPQLLPMLLVLSCVPFLQAISAAPNAEIERREDYRGIARVQMLSTTVSLGLAVALALAGAGIWALVAQQVSLALVRFVGIARLSRFRPQWRFSTIGLRPHLVFARDTLIVSALVVARNQLPVIAIGKMLGQIPLGYYSMSERLTRLPQFGIAGPMSSVVYVRMSKAQHDSARLCDIYLASMRLLAVALIPPMAVVAAAGGPVFTFLLSAEWQAVAPIFALSVGGLVLEAIAIFTLQPLFRVLSRTDLLVRISLEGLILRTALILPAALISVEAVALSLTLWALVIVPRGWQMAARLIPLAISACLLTLLPACAAALAMVLAWLVLASSLAMTPLAATVMACLLSLAGCGLTLLLDGRGMRAALRVFRAEATHPAPSAIPTSPVPARVAPV